MSALLPVRRKAAWPLTPTIRSLRETYASGAAAMACRSNVVGMNTDPNRADLEARWLYLTRELLPSLTSTRAWPVGADHCFQRILLDHAVGGCWYDHVARRPAYRHIDIERLATAVALGKAVAAGAADLHVLNAQSLAWRRAAVAKPRRRSG